MQAEVAPDRHQRARDRVLELPLRQDELDLPALPGLVQRVARRQLRDHRQPGPGMRRQVLLADAMRGFRRPAGQRQAHHQRRRVGPIAQPHLGLQRHHAIVIRGAPRQPRLLAAGRAGRIIAPLRGGRLVGDDGQVPRRQLAAVAPHREMPARGQVAIGLVAGRVQRAERLRVSVERQRRRAAAAGHADGEAGAGRHRHRAAVRLEEDRRQPRIGRRGDPGLQLGGRRRDVARHRRLHRLRQPRGRIVAGDRDGGDQGEHQRGPQRARIAPRQAGTRQADAQPAHRAHRARDMRLPQRDRRRIGSARCRATAGRSAPPAAGGRGPEATSRRRSAALSSGAAMVRSPRTSSPRISSRGDREQPDMPPRRQQARQVEQCGADEHAGNAERRPQRRPDALEQDGEAGQRAAAGKPAQQAIELSARGVHSSQCGTRSPRHKSAWLSRSRITDQSLPSTITSAATGRAL